MVEIPTLSGYPGPMSSPVPSFMPSPMDSVISSLLEEGRREAIATVAEGQDATLVVLQFADQLRKAADRLCQESAEAARGRGASWRLIGEAVGGITPQG